MTCAHCGRALKPDARFCDSCGNETEGKTRLVLGDSPAAGIEGKSGDADHAPITTAALDTEISILAEAARLLEEGRVTESARRYQSLLERNKQLVDAHYGLGVSELKLGHFEAAEEALKQTLALGRRNANALYYLGVVAERLEKWPQALQAYDEALAAAPMHAAARSARAALWVNERCQEKTRTPEIPNPTDRLGVYAHLLTDESLLSKQCLLALRRLRFEYRPSWITMYGMALPYFQNLLVGWSSRVLRVPLGAMIGAVLLAVGISLRPTISMNPVAGGPPQVVFPTIGILAMRVMVLWVLLQVFFAVWAAIRSFSMTVTTDRGRLQQHWGVLWESRTNLEFWRIQSLELRRSLIQRTFGLGYFVATIHDGDTVIIPAFHRGADQEQLYQDMLDLIYLLRANPVVKGIIY